MTRTEPLEATRYDDLGKLLNDRTPGSFLIVSQRDLPGLWFCSICPCGCGKYSALAIGKGEKPKAKPSWSWDGDEDRPTLKPSINHVDHWHGWLTGGIWKSV